MKTAIRRKLTARGVGQLPERLQRIEKYRKANERKARLAERRAGSGSA